MQSTRNLRSIPNLMNERLIHLEEPIRERPTWSDWFAHHDIPNRDIHAGLRLNDYALVLQAAVSGRLRLWLGSHRAQFVGTRIIACPQRLGMEHGARRLFGLGTGQTPECTSH